MSEEEYFGRDCPEGMVQVEFVGVDPALKHSEYGWKPSQYAFLEIYVDGKRFRIDVGNWEGLDGTQRRGLHIVGPMHMQIHHHSVNAVDIYLEW